MAKFGEVSGYSDDMQLFNLAAIRTNSNTLWGTEYIMLKKDGHEVPELVYNTMIDILMAIWDSKDINTEPYITVEDTPVEW